MTNYDRLHAAMRDGQAVPRWASGALGAVASNRTSIVGVRHPLGFLCLPLERDGTVGICVHIWSDGLPRTNPTTSMIHAHSWDLISYVLYGSVRNEVVDVADAPDGAMYRVFEIRSGHEVDEVRETPRLVRCRIRAAELSHQGDVYSLAAGIFHATVVQGEAATLALGSGRPGTLDLSLGAIHRTTHRVRRQRCDRDETAHAARMVAQRLEGIGTVDEENRCEDRDPDKSRAGP